MKESTKGHINPLINCKGNGKQVGICSSRLSDDAGLGQNRRQNVLTKNVIYSKVTYLNPFFSFGTYLCMSFLIIFSFS